MIGLAMCQLPDERLTRLEVLAILAVTITRLERNKLPLATKIVPFMIISLFCRMKARFWLVILLLND
jgi:hypothetical protein